MLAGVSCDYYTRLEQGRELSPSDQVLDALARALQLNPEAAHHLHALAHSTCDRRRPESTDRVHPDVLRLLDSWSDKPALVVNQLLDVLAQNSLIGAFHDGLAHADNIMRLTFLEPRIRELWVNWEEQARSRVAHLRSETGKDPGSALVELVEELSRESEDFRRIWAKCEVWTDTGYPIYVHHSGVGDLTIRYQSFTVESAPSQRLVVFQTEPGSPSEQALSRLRAIHARPDRAAHGSTPKKHDEVRTIRNFR
ncbi:helix-turn-helix transcriptional regulator [Planotetraspora phitsanulokensis]|uniref:Transcriptional regulator n=2 Tax=Planotetraspora phitsanulokensis TaxID=575192 RepID=A0A8J3UB88_9ACTN|nr:transcriptional regulator [Planotetraspora phitsanulokensis]